MEVKNIQSARIMRSYLPVIIIVAAVHTGILVELLQVPLPFAWSGAAMFIVAVLLYRSGVFLWMGALGTGMHAILLVLQLLIAMGSFMVDPSFIMSMWFLLLFVGIECVRFLMMKRVTRLEQEVKQLQAECENMNETFRVIRGQRHDFLKHVSAIHFMMANEEHTEAKSYLDELVNTYEETNASIKGEKGAIAGTLNLMYRRAQQENIDVVYDLDIPISSMSMKDQDAVALIGNILSNAIDASVSWKQEYGIKPELQLQFYKRSGFYLLTCSNRSLPIPTHVLDSLFKKFGQTTKAGEHEGLGAKLIIETVAKYNGFFDFTYKEERFSVKIKIPSIR